MLAMNSSIYGLIVSILSVVDGGFIFLISLGAEFALFTVIFFLSALKRLYSFKKRAWYFISSLAVLALELGFLTYLKQTELYHLSLGITLIFFCVIVCIPERKLKVSEKQRELANLLFEKAKKESETQTIKVEQEMERELEREIQPPVVPRKSEDASRFELDFQHVKSVIQKLEYYPLTQSDKKQVKELEDNIYTAETEGFTGLLKSKINDGLGALLKIMSKYGV